MGAKKLSTIFRENLAKYGRLFHPSCRLFPKYNEEEERKLISKAGFNTPDEVIEWADRCHDMMSVYSNILFNFEAEFTTKALREEVANSFIARVAYYSFVSKLFKDGPITSAMSLEEINELLEAGVYPENIPALALIAKNSEILNWRSFELDEIIDLNCYLLFKKDDMTVQMANRRNYLSVRDAMRGKEP